MRFQGLCETVVPTGPVDRISHRKWRETKQQLILLPDLALLGRCFVSLLFLCDILSTGMVQFIDFDLVVPMSALVCFGQLQIWQNSHGSYATWWNSQIKVNKI